MEIKIKVVILLVFLILVIQEFYRRRIYNYISTNFKDFNKLSSEIYNEYVENLYEKSLTRDDKTDFGQYYDKVNYKFFEISSTHNASIIKKSMFTESPYLFDYLISNIKDGDTILDCGCGTGSFSMYIASKMPNINIVCVTNSHKCLEHTNEKITKNNLENRVKAYLLDFDNLLQNSIIANKNFDAIFFLESHGYSKNRIQLFKDCYTLLKQDGILYLRTPTFSDSQHISLQHIVNFWKYNFSTTNNICLDLSSIGFNLIKYKDINALILMASYHITDLIKIFLFLLTNSNFYNCIKTHFHPVIKNLQYSVIKCIK